MTPLCNIGDIPIDAIIRIKRRLLLTDKIIVYKTLIKYGYRYTQNVLFKQGEMPWFGGFFANMENQEETVYWTILVTEIKKVI